MRSMVEGARGKQFRCLGPPPSVLRAATSPFRGGLSYPATGSVIIDPVHTRWVAFTKSLGLAL